MRPSHSNPMQRTFAAFMLALAAVYLLHSASHAAFGEPGHPPPGAASVLALDPFVMAEAQSGDGLVGCHFFCNHGCPVPPLPQTPALPSAPDCDSFRSKVPEMAHLFKLAPKTSPPRA